MQSKLQWDTISVSRVAIKKKGWEEISVGEGVEKLEPLYIVGGKVTQCSLFKVWQFMKI